MKPADAAPLIRLERSALIAAAGGAAVAAVLAWVSPRDFAPAYRFAFFVCLGPALGSLMFALIHRLTGGNWGELLRPFFQAGVTLLPWIWVVAALILWLPLSDAPAWPAYASRPMMGLRAGVYAAIFFVLSTAMRRAETRPERGDFAWLGPVGLIGLVFTLHLLTDDWAAALEPRWHSTGFGLVCMTSQAVAGLSIALLVAVACGRPGLQPLPPLPGEPEESPRDLRIDCGNLLLATMLLWCYVAFAQLLIIWSGNLPREISWYERRVQGGWLIVAAALPIIHFAVPFVFLLSRRVKRVPAALARIAALLLAAQVLYMAWAILPAAPVMEPTLFALAAALLVAGGGIFLNRYLAAARRYAEIT